MLHDELARICHRTLARERSGFPLETSELLSEVYLRLRELRNFQFDTRRPFLALVARTARRVIVDTVRERGAEKRGGSVVMVDLNEIGAAREPLPVDVIAFDDLLRDLEQEDAELAQLIDLRIVMGLTEAESADALGVSRSTVQRQWRAGRRLLANLLS